MSKREVIEAIKTLQQFMSTVAETELVIGRNMLRVLPENDEYDLGSALDVFNCVNAVRTLQGFTATMLDNEVVCA